MSSTEIGLTITDKGFNLDSISTINFFRQQGVPELTILQTLLEFRRQYQELDVEVSSAEIEFLLKSYQLPVPEDFFDSPLF